MKHFPFVILILAIAPISFGSIDLKTLFEWKFVNYTWSPKVREQALNTSNYNPNTTILYDVDRADDGRIFVTAVREPGVPASLMTVSKEIGPGGPLLAPYPDWSWYQNNQNNQDNCSILNSIISVYRVTIKCNRLFVLDCGKIGEEIICPPRLLIFDLRNDKLLKNIIIPREYTTGQNGTGLFVTSAVYVRHCRHIDDATVYMADIEGFGVVIYNERTSFCRIESTDMEPTNPNFTINGQSFHLKDGVLGLTLIKKDLYYSPLAGNEIYKMRICNEECKKLDRNEINNLTELAGTLSGQTAAIASEECAIFFSNIEQTSILCQDTTKEFNSTNTELIAQDSTRLQFASGMKVLRRGRRRSEERRRSKSDGKELMILTNRFQRYFTKTFNPSEINFRILIVDIEQIRNNTNCFDSCDRRHRHGRHGHRHGHRLWHGRPWFGRPWLGPWHRGPFYHFDKQDKNYKDNKDDKNDRSIEDDKDDKNNEDSTKSS